MIRRGAIASLFLFVYVMDFQKSYRLFNKVYCKTMKKKVLVNLEWPFEEDLEVRVYGEVKGNDKHFYIIEAISDRGDLWSNTYSEQAYMIYDIKSKQPLSLIFLTYSEAYDYCIYQQSENCKRQ